MSSNGALLVFVAVLLARVVGKPLGVWLGATLLPGRFMSAADDRPPSHVRLGLGTAASVGFTVSLLITRVAFGEGAQPEPLLLPDGFEGHPLRKDFVLASRVVKPWPGAKEPGEGPETVARRQPMRPPGVPAPGEWGP